MPKNSLLNAYEFSSMFDLGFDKKSINGKDKKL